MEYKRQGRGKALPKPQQVLDLSVCNSRAPKYLHDYIKEKIRMLTGQFYIRLTDEEVARFWDLQSDGAVDRYAHRLLMKYL